MELVNVCLGIGLAASCGLRVFTPLLVLGLAAHFGHLPLASNLAWVASGPALLTLSVASVAEILAYYIPFVDNLLDSVHTPLAVAAGTLAAAAPLTHFDPVVQWSLALIAGGGVAGTIQGATLLGRGLSTVTTGGLGNPVFATLENTGAIGLSILALILPVLTALLVLAVLVWAVRLLLRRRRPA